MSLATTSIQRPVFTLVLSALIILFGGIGYFYLGIREYPSLDAPIITVSTGYQGANAEIIESQITEPLEEAVNGIAGIRSISSVSRDGRSTITVEFNLEIDLETAANDVRDKVSQAIRNLPPDADPPSVQKADSDAQAIIFLTIQSDIRPMLEISSIATNVFKERLQTIPGVSSIQVWGEQRYSMKLFLNSAKMAAYGITPIDVKRALDRENIELPSGRVEGNSTELSVRTLGRLKSPEDFNNLIIREEGASTIRLSDIGQAVMASENDRTLLRRNGISMVGNGIVPQPGSNHIAIADEVYKRVAQIEKELPDDIKVGVGFDTTEYIRASISEVQETIITAFILVVLIIFLFLRDWRTTIIPVLVIPISLIGTFFFLYLFDYSINVLSLLGVVLAIGLVVDDAIVVLENIYAKIEKGMNPLQAGFKGSSEIFIAVIATTLALVAVFMPIVFLQGLTGRLFREFGVTIAAAVCISSFVALTLTPMLATRLLKHREKPTWFYRVTEPAFVWMTRLYADSLEGFMRFRWLAFPISIGMVAGAAYFMQQVPEELAPLEDRGMVRVFATGPEGASFQFMDDYVKDLIALIDKEVPEKKALITVTAPGFGASSSVNTAFGRLVLGSPEGRRPQAAVAADLMKKMSVLSEAKGMAMQEPSIGDRRARYPIQFVIQAAELDKLKEALPRFAAKAADNEVFGQIDVDLKFTKPEVLIEIDREKANSLGVSIMDIAQTLQLGLSGQRFGYFYLDGKQYQVIGQLSKDGRDDPSDIRTLFVRNNQGELIQLDNLLSTKERSTPPQLFRFNRFASATVSATLQEGKTIADGIDAMRAIAKETLDDSFSTDLSGGSRDFLESSSSLQFAFTLALILVYMVLAAQFESFRDPLVIMFTVPLALSGALGSLWVFGQTINIFSKIGVIMLIGLVTKNGILIVEFANQKKAEGMDRMQAALTAASERFRAILMTALSTILGTLPIALALGAGSESRVSMGIAVVGGMFLSTFLTLYIIPAIYTYISGKEAVVIKETEEVEAMP